MGFCRVGPIPEVKPISTILHLLTSDKPRKLHWVLSPSVASRPSSNYLWLGKRICNSSSFATPQKTPLNPKFLTFAFFFWFCTVSLQKKLIKSCRRFQSHADDSTWNLTPRDHNLISSTLRVKLPILALGRTTILLKLVRKTYFGTFFFSFVSWQTDEEVTRSRLLQQMLRISQQSSNFVPGKHLVKKSAGFLEVWIFARLTIRLDTISRMKLNCVSMCLVLSWCTAFLDRAIALWESQCILTLSWW